MAWRAAAALLFLLQAATVISQQTCTVNELDGSSTAFQLGKFTSYPGINANCPSTATACSACPGPQAAQGSMPFFFGTATASYQVEGAAAVDGRTPSMWDIFSKLNNGAKISDGSNGDVADTEYTKFLSDIELLKSLGVRNYRMSLSWTRLFKNGNVSTPNALGIAFYNKVFDALDAACITPWVTLYHWDLPQPLNAAYGGWISPQIVTDFSAYARECFKLFGGRVKRWFTLNEPETYCSLGYGEWGVATHAPGRCSDRTQCAAGNSYSEPHQCSYYSVLAHIAAVKEFRKYVPDGMIGMTNAIGWAEPYTLNANDTAAAARQQNFSGATYLDPLYFGDWPPERKTVYGHNLPTFSKQQKADLANATLRPDFIALQHYTGNYVYYDPNGGKLQTGSTTKSADGVQLVQAASSWLYVFPQGLNGVLRWLSKRYGAQIPIFITENGVSVPGEAPKPNVPVTPFPAVLCDNFRVNYYQRYLANAVSAKNAGVNVRGYFAWSLLDNFEWAEGYSERFGINYVDYSTQDRYYKASGMWLSKAFGLGGVTAPPA